MYIYIYIYIFIYTYTYTCVYIYIHTYKGWLTTISTTYIPEIDLKHNDYI